jgi:EAL domain-containing protein (putative c-di-GMP-specific phosphodiesterase class I)
VARLGWAERIRDALDNDRFTLQMQPIVDLRTRSVERAELLIRMRGQREELIPPSSFLPVAERFGHIRAIDRWVLDQALALLRRQRRGDALTLHVNLSGATITDPELCNALPARIAREAPVPSRLVLEITETAAIENIAAAQELTRRLAALGCGIALDDFGSGFGSFYYLKHLPFSALKIDGEFVKHITASRADRVTVQAIVDMARGLGKTTVAECVEQEGTLELLRRLHVDFAQGFHLARPTAVPAAPPGAPE